PSAGPAVAPPDPSGRTSCAAWSLEAHGDADRREAADLERCGFVKGEEGELAPRCGFGAARRDVPLARLEQAVLGFDAPTRAHLRELAARGRALGRRARVFGLVGDSLTTTAMFLGAFGASRGAIYRVDPLVGAALRTRVDGDEAGTIVDWYRGVDAARGADSFTARRAARDGAPARWAATAADARTPVGELVAELSPAVAVVLFGTNDAHVPATPLAELARRFAADLGAVLDELEQAGVVPVLTTLPRHGDAPKRAGCDKKPGDLSDWRVAVQTNALNAVVVALACERHLPLVDLRHALEPLVNHGLDEDGMHLSGFGGGIGVLDPASLGCGYAVRNFVTLRMLAQVKEAIEPAAP
ncbi:MAG: SGNH/GDSL hydrolase family protein, partial [Myxococcales bacterium]|nr:SGNH/GDSL hydrolase family protein [Myxococcales bacterium]